MKGPNPSTCEAKPIVRYSARARNAAKAEVQSAGRLPLWAIGTTGSCGLSTDGVQAVDPPMPSDDASDGEWDAWTDLQDLQAILTGLASSQGSPNASAADRSEWREPVSTYLAEPSVIALLGDAADDARSLAAALGVLAPR